MKFEKDLKFPTISSILKASPHSQLHSQLLCYACGQSKCLCPIKNVQKLKKCSFSLILDQYRILQPSLVRTPLLCQLHPSSWCWIAAVERASVWFCIHPFGHLYTHFVCSPAGFVCSPTDFVPCHSSVFAHGLVSWNGAGFA